ncbi:hypothetical protein ACIBBB_18240 [Streptomyces sp. NPDC051217]|uniref:hypothetical protein n=1 Tax=Streptomyces sp. NPDC051217 TaxID=3365644 RepID=UPI003794F0C7
MAISISLVLLLLVLTVIFVRNSGLKLGHAIICVLLGFFLAGTSMAPTIQDGIDSTANVVSGLQP